MSQATVSPDPKSKKEFKGDQDLPSSTTQEVAIVTGAGSGIGRAIAKKCADLGMSVALLDIDEEGLQTTQLELQQISTQVMSCTVDVSQASALQSAIDSAEKEFGAINYLFNNAGVGPGEGILEADADDWQWGLGVNLMAAVHAIRHVVPIMRRGLAQQRSADSETPSPFHIVNTASVAGLMPFHPDSVYQVSKHALVALSEHLYHSLSLRGLNIGVSVFCPSYVNTNILNSRRPHSSAAESEPSGEDPIKQRVHAHLQQRLENSLSPTLAVDRLFEGMVLGEFYIFTDSDHQAAVMSRLQTIRDQRRPEPVEFELA